MAYFRRRRPSWDFDDDCEYELVQPRRRYKEKHRNAIVDLLYNTQAMDEFIEYREKKAKEKEKKPDKKNFTILEVTLFLVLFAPLIANAQKALMAAVGLN